MHMTDIKKMGYVQLDPSTVRLRDYSKTTIPTRGQATFTALTVEHTMK